MKRGVAACIVSASVAAAAVAIYSLIENGVEFEVFGILVIAFLFSLAVAFFIGIPILYLSNRIGKAKPIYFAMAGSFSGLVFMAMPLAHSRGADPSVLKLALVLSIAGFTAGWTFYRVSRRADSNALSHDR